MIGCWRNSRSSDRGRLAHSRHVYHVYAVRACRAAMTLLKALQEQRHRRRHSLSGPGSSCRRPMRILAIAAGDFPVTETLADQFLSLPIYPELLPEQVAEVVMQLEKVAFVEAA